MGLPARLVAVVFSPYKAFAAVAARPRWFGALAIGLLIICVGQFWLLSTEVGQQAVLDQQVSALEAFGQEVSDEQYENFERGLPVARYFALVQTIIVAPLIYAIIAGLILGVFTAIMGGNATFRQVFAVVVHASFVVAAISIVTVPLNYVRESLSSPFSLSALLPMLDAESAGGMFLGMLDLLWIWWFVALGIGIGVLYNRRAGPVITGFLALYVGVVLVITGIRLAI
jgi:hypothetical protein